MVLFSVVGDALLDRSCIVFQRVCLEVISPHLK